MLNHKGFDLWADGYDKSVGLSDEANTYPFAGYKKVLAAIFQTVMQTPNASVLDIGFGTAVLTARLYEQGCTIYGQDFSSRMLELASEKMPDAQLYQGDFTKGLVEPLRNVRYDYIVATYSLHHLTDAQKNDFLLDLRNYLKKNGKITEMRALQAQINPHFLYNSLSIINWKAIEADEQEISKVTLALSTYYRTSLNRGETMTTVVSEMENIRAYLKIQLIMHDNSFRVEEVYDNTMGSCEIPKLILQPLVENAIDHGLDVSEKIEKVLRIKVVQDELFLYFMVEDNGNGMTEEKASQIVTYRSKGYGVRNVNERIVLLYGEENKIRVESKEGEGTRVCIRIPKKKENGHEKQETKN